MPDQDSAPITPAPQPAETKPVAWTPEDASRFFAMAIREAESPLREDLKHRPVTTGMFMLIVAVLVLGGFAVALLLSSQLEKTEQRAEAVNRQREELLTEKVTLEAKSTFLEERLTSAAEQITSLSGNGEELRSARNDLARFRRQNELLRSQISGLEMEKVALARQLEAVKAMAVEDSLAEEIVITESAAAEDAEPEEPAKPAEIAAAPIANAVSVVVEPPVIAATAEPTETLTVPVPNLTPVEPATIRPAEPEPAPEPAPAPATPEPVGEPVIETIPEPVPEAAPEPVPFEAAAEQYGEQLANGEAAPGQAEPAEPAAEEYVTLEEPPAEEKAEPAAE